MPLVEEKLAGASSMVEPQNTADLGDATPGDTRGDGLESEGQNPYHTPQAGTPVSLVPPVPPGWGDTPVLPGAGTRSVPIGGMEYFSKVFSHEAPIWTRSLRSQI